MFFQRKIIIPTLQLFFVLILSLVSFQSMATHYRAGEILYEQISGRRYRIIAYSYTDPNSQADAGTAQIRLFFGDFTDQTVQRTRRTFLSSRVVQNVYEVIHEYSSDGEFTLSFYDENRVDGIININNGRTDLLAFYVETTIVIDNSFGPNKSPVLTKAPIDNGCINKPYFHNPSAYDPDGDSLVFEIIPPKIRQGTEVPLYLDPEADSTFHIGINDGQLFWHVPKAVGIYNIAIKITQFRKGFPMGYLIRDMQIFIDNCANNPPIVQNVPDGCVVVGDSISRIITANDPDASQIVTLSGLGGAFATQRSATFSPNPASGQGMVSTLFKWKPTCNQIRLYPWQVIFEARDQAAGSPAVSQNSFNVRVIAPSVKNFKSVQVDKGFMLTWNQDSCQMAESYKIYRRVDSSRWNPGICETGIPASTGFVEIASIKTLNNPNATQYYDNANGKGLSPLVNYCYRIVSSYPPRNTSGDILYGDNSLSIASAEICDNIVLSEPAITRASISITSVTAGKIELSYIRPDTLDTLTYLPPYRFILKRSVSGQNNYAPVSTRDYTSFAAIADISVTDSLLNTEQNQYTYLVEMWATMNGVLKPVDSSSLATSVRSVIFSTDRTNILSWYYDVPWQNDTFIVYRKNQLGIFDSIAWTTQPTYTDTGLFNKTEYCYLVETRGVYRSKQQLFSTYNFSQEICGTPIDTVSPCPPMLVVAPPCNQLGEYRTNLSWTPQAGCAGDVVKYRIYYKQLTTDDFTQLAEVPATSLTYVDDREVLKEAITGCYYVSGVDSANNESRTINEVCIENCPQYTLPNVFTPNGDGKNDLFIPFPYRFVSRIDMIIYNRWGVDVFKTTDKNILWNGKDQQSGQECTEGVYFYTCKVYEIYLDGVRERLLNGTIQIIR